MLQRKDFHELDMQNYIGCISKAPRTCLKAACPKGIGQMFYRSARQRSYSWPTRLPGIAVHTEVSRECLGGVGCLISKWESFVGCLGVFVGRWQSWGLEGRTWRRSPLPRPTSLPPHSFEESV
jgi:hypothetical protein